jgi:protein SCO1/2
MRALPLAVGALAIVMLTAASPLEGYFPNVMVTTHDNRRVRFFDDLVKGRTVAINFMFTSCTQVCPRSTANLRKLQERVQERLGKDVLMISISIDPSHDTPQVLARYVAANGVQPGWLFVTGSRADIDRLRRRLASADDQDDPAQHTGMLTYGNEPAGQWRTANVMAAPDKLARDLLRMADGKFW